MNCINQKEIQAYKCMWIKKHDSQYRKHKVFHFNITALINTTIWKNCQYKDTTAKWNLFLFGVGKSGNKYIYQKLQQGAEVSPVCVET